MQPLLPSSHAYFFSSLRQVEKRLKLDSCSSSSAVSPPPPTTEISTDTQIDSLSTPVYLHSLQPSMDTNSSALQESEAPQEFLSNSPDFPPTQKDSGQETNARKGEELNAVESRDLDDIKLLMELLGLADVEGEEEPKRGGIDFGCDDEFYRKIVGVKGPRSLKEVERLDGWIKHFGAEEIKEPLRLAHLLLGKAAFVHSLDGSDEFGGLEFLSTIDEFLLNDPPIDVAFVASGRISSFADH